MEFYSTWVFTIQWYFVLYCSSPTMNRFIFYYYLCFSPITQENQKFNNLMQSSRETAKRWDNSGCSFQFVHSNKNCDYLLKSPKNGDSNKYPQYTVFIQKYVKQCINYCRSLPYLKSCLQFKVLQLLWVIIFFSLLWIKTSNT